MRLDSGDLAAHARKVRRILDDGGLSEVTIFASGGLDERKLQRYVADGVPIDGYGVGTSLTTSEDAPAFDCAYKLQEYDGLPKRKRSEGKATWPGRKQVYRSYADDGMMAGDVLTLEDDVQAGEPLIREVMRHGERLGSPPTAGRDPPALRGRARASAGPPAPAGERAGLSGRDRRRAARAGAGSRPR